MLTILFSTDEFSFLEQEGLDELKKLRQEFSVFKVSNSRIERPLLKTKQGTKLYSFSGSKVNRTLQLLFNISGFKNNLDDQQSSFDLEIGKDELLAELPNFLDSIKNLDKSILDILKENPSIMDFSKWGQLLPDKFKMKLLKEKYYDLLSTEELLQDLKIKVNS